MSASKPEVDRMFDEVLEKMGTPAVLVNNSGVQTWKSLLDLTEEEWDRVLRTNLKGTFLCTQRPARHMAVKAPGPDHQYRLGVQQGTLPQPG